MVAETLITRLTHDTLNCLTLVIFRISRKLKDLKWPKIKLLAKRLCTDVDIKLVFSSYKIKNFFSFKDPIPNALKSFVVYQFTCAGCKSHYIGETTRHFSTRIKEHTLTDRNSHVFKHLNNSVDCKSSYSNDCFKILDSARTAYFLKVKEGIYIKHLKPEWNAQVQSGVPNEKNFKSDWI